MNKKTIISIALVAVILANITYLAGRFFHSPELFYTGRDEVVGADKSVYISMIEEVKQGSFFLHNLFTSEPQEARIFHPLWLVLGWVAAITQLPSLDIFEMSRIVVGPFFLFWIGKMCNRLFSQKPWALIAFVLIAFSSGVGAFFLPSGRHLFIGEEISMSISADLLQPEMNTFASLMHSPLFLVSQALILFIFFQWTVWEARRDRRTFCIILIASAVLSSIHPYDTVIIGAVLGVRVILCRRFFVAYALMLLASGLPAISFLFSIGREIGLAGWFTQNLTFASSPLQYFSGFGLLLPFALWGIWEARRGSDYWKMLRIWLCVALLLLYMPSQFQRRFINGVHIPLALLATYGLYAFFIMIRHRRLVLIASVWFFIIGFFGSSFYLIGEAAVTLLEDSKRQLAIAHHIIPANVDRALAFSLYVPKATADAVLWLRDHTLRDSVILATPAMSNVVPEIAARRVWMGHGHQTNQSIAKRKFLYQWIFPRSAYGRRNLDTRVLEFFFRNEGIDYLLWTPLEQQLGSFVPEEKPYLQEVYRNADARIYKFVSVR